MQQKSSLLSKLWAVVCVSDFISRKNVAISDLPVDKVIFVLFSSRRAPWRRFFHQAVDCSITASLATRERPLCLHFCMNGGKGRLVLVFAEDGRSSHKLPKSCCCPQTLYT